MSLDIRRFELLTNRFEAIVDKRTNPCYDMNERSFATEKGLAMAEVRVQRSESTRNEIIRDSHDLFVQQGYHGTSMRQIAKEVGIALGGLYNHFGSKEEVFQAVFLEYHPYHEILPALEAAEGDTAEDLIRNAAARAYKVLGDRPDFLNLMFIEVVEFNSIHVRELFAKLLPQGMQVVQRILEVDRERLRPIPSLMLARTFLGMIFGYFLSEVILAQNSPLEFQEDAETYFIDIFLNGVLKKD